jgi:methylenetetrahydrofolate reductase (NADPH)
VVTDELFELAEKYAAGPDKGRAFFHELAAKQLAVFKGLGFAGGYLGGINNAQTFGRIIDLAESFGENDWREFLKEIRFSQPDEFFLFDHDPETGLGDPTRINPEYLRSLDKPPRTRHVTPGYRFSRLLHRWFFTPDQGLWGLMKRLYSRWDRKGKPTLLSRLAQWTEQKANRLAYRCDDCGDCSLPDCAHLCPIAYCSKHSRNGPCGGSAGGRCELDDKECFWARVYERLKYYGESETLADGPPVFDNANLQHTSSWANIYLGRDHHRKPDEEQA